MMELPVKPFTWPNSVAVADTISTAGSNQGSSLKPRGEVGSVPPLAAWGLRPHHQIKLPNMWSAASPLVIAEDVESNQSQLHT